MADEDSGRMTLQGTWQELLALHRDYPEDAPNEERVEYFQMAIRLGLKTHRKFGLTDEVALERMGMSTGISGQQLMSWVEKRRAVHPNFHLGALLAQAALAEDYIKACQETLEKIGSYLGADDWRAELGAFDHLKAIGLDTLLKYGGSLEQTWAKRLENIETRNPDGLSLDLKRKALNLIADALEDLIGEPEQIVREAARSADDPHPAQRTIN